MPRSKVRKRNGRAVNRVSPPRNGQPIRAAKMVAQRSLGLMLDELELLLHAVPLTYDPTDIVATIGHHHHSTAVVNFLRTHDVPGIIAAMGAGAMIVPDDGTPTQEANIVQSPTLDDLTIDKTEVRWVSYAEMVDAQRAAEAYAGPEDEVALIGRPPLPTRVSGASMAPELRDGEPVEQVPTDVVERLLEGLQASAPTRLQWSRWVGYRLAIPEGTINANTKGHKPFERGFRMQVHEAVDMGGRTAILTGRLLRADGTPARVTKRVLLTWEQAETWRS